MNHCGKACVCFVAPHGYPLELLDLTEEVFYQVALLVNIGVNNERFRSPWMLGDNDFRAAFVEVFDNPIGVERFVSDQPAEIDAFFSASSISAINKTLDESLRAFSERSLADPFPYLILDARYERIREGGVIVSQAVLVAVAVDWEGRRQILAVELANRESRSSWRDFLLSLRKRGLSGVEFVGSDDHAGLKSAIREVLPEAVWQRCYVHFLRNALDYVPRKVDDDCLRQLRWFYDRRELAEVRRDIEAWLSKWQVKYPKLCAWVEEHIEETLSYYRLPLAHHKHMKSTNMLERLNMRERLSLIINVRSEIKRRTHVVRIFPNPESCLRLVRALAVETHENWLEAKVSACRSR